MRKIIAVTAGTALLLCSACRLTLEPTFGNDQNCSGGNNQRSSSCTPNSH